MLTRAQMEKVIKEGGAVLHAGQHILSLADLPGDAELAKGDQAEEDRLLASYDEQVAALHKKKDAILQQRAAQRKELAKEPAKNEPPKK